MRYDDVHVVAGPVLRRYQGRRKQLLDLNAQLMRLRDWPPVRAAAPVEATDDFVAFHTWVGGFEPFGPDDVAALAELEAGLPATGGRGALAERLADAGWLDAGAPDLDAVVRRALVDFPALQNPVELGRFLEIVRDRRPEIVVEIGTAGGGTFYAVAALAAPEATLVSVDLPPSAMVDGAPDLVFDLLPGLARRGQRVHLVRGNSLAADTRAEVALVLGGRPIDLLIVDGDHSYGTARADVETFGALVRPGGLIALHDAAIGPAEGGSGFDVNLLWRELAPRHRSELLVDPDGAVGARGFMRTGRRMACGWGLLHV
jgi:cephalosporin hydroxylase